MSDANKTVVRRWFEEVWNQGRVSAIDELASVGSVFHGLGPAPLLGREAFKPVHAAYRAAFPDIHVTVGDVIAEGDQVALRWAATATHRGDGFGIRATGRQVQFAGLGIARVENGQVVECWNAFDEAGMMRQIGAV
jgi:steroid delta-isomerase-like uncharacterized protein